MSFKESVVTCLWKYGTFDGTATRSEFWWFVVFQILISILAAFCDVFAFPNDDRATFGTISGLLLILPGIAVSVRRLHDVGYSGWWWWLTFTGIGNLLLLYWYLQPSDRPYRAY